MSPDSPPWYARSLEWLIRQPNGVALVGFVMLMALIVTYGAGTVRDIQGLKTSQAEIQRGQETIITKIDAAANVAAATAAEQIKLLRGICLIQSKGSEDLALRYCNP